MRKVATKLMLTFMALMVPYVVNAQRAPVANLHVERTTISSVTVAWDDQSDVLSWIVEFGLSGFAEGSGTRVSVAGNASITISQLAEQTSYDVYVTANYGAWGVSDSRMVQAVTLFEPYRLPFVCDFETGNVNGNWKFANGRSANVWMVGHNTRYSGDSSLYVSNYSGTYHDSNSYANASTVVYGWIGLQFDTAGTYAISFDWRAGGEPLNDYLRVALAQEWALPEAEISEPANGMGYNTLPQGWTALDGGTGLNGSTAWSTYTGNFVVSQPGLYKLMVCWVNNNRRLGNPPAAIDNIRIEKTRCSIASGLRVTALTHTTATCVWDEGDGAHWVAEYSARGTQARHREVLYRNELQINNLTPNTQYDLRVFPVCGYGDTGMASYITFVTGCSPIDVPYSESFDGGSNSCIQTQGGEVTVANGTMTIGGNGTTYVVWPATNVRADSLKVFLKYRQNNLDNGELTLGYMQNIYDESSFRPLQTLEASLIWTSTLHDLGYDGAPEPNAHIALRYISPGNFGAIIDSISIENAAVCKKVTNLRVTSVDDSRVSVAWNTPNSGILWQVEYGYRGYTPFTSDRQGVLYSMTRDADITGLQGATDYDVYVRAICGRRDTGVAERIRVRTSPTPQPGVPYLVYADSITSTSARINFSIDAEGASYQIAYSYSSNIPPTTSSLHETLTANHATWSNLQPMTDYYYAVRSINGNNISAWSEVSHFRTMPDCDKGYQIIARMPLDRTAHNGIMWQHYDAATLAASDVHEGDVYNLAIEYAGIMHDSVNMQIYMANGNQSNVSGMTCVYNGTVKCVAGSSWTEIPLDVPYHCINNSDITVAIRCSGHLETPSWGSTLTMMLCNSSPASYHQIFADCNAEYGYVEGVGLYRTNSIATLCVRANHGYRFARWANGDTSSRIQFVVNRDTTLRDMSFVLDSFSITTVTNDASAGMIAGPRRVAYRQNAILTATPTPNHHFCRWGDGSTVNPRSITVSGDTLVTAFFAIDTYMVNISANFGGTVSGGGRYQAGDTVVASATASANYYFYHWSDGNTDNPRIFIAEHDTTLQAQFITGVVSVTVQCDTSMGTAYGSGLYRSGDRVTLYVTPRPGFHFVRWNDGQTTNRRTIVVNRDVVYTAIIEPNYYTVMTRSADPQRGYTTGDSMTVAGTTLVLQAIPLPGYMFVAWHDGSTSNPRTITVTADSVFTAAFGYALYRVSVECDTSMGSVAGTGFFSYGDSTNLVARARSGYRFVRWEDGSTTATRRLVVDRDTLLHAYFEPNRYMIYVRSSDESQGTVTGYGMYGYGTQASIAAHAVYGYRFSHWDDSNTVNPRIIDVQGNASYMAFFEPDVYSVQVLSDNLMMGIVAGSGSYLNGDTSLISATANQGCRFVRWNDGETANPRRIVVRSNCYYTAIFETSMYRLGVTYDTSMGVVSGMGVYAYGSTAVLAATAKRGHAFNGWSDGNTSSVRSMLMVGDTTIGATFSRLRYSVSAVSANDNIGRADGSGSYLFGDTAVVTAVPTTGYHFVRWNDGNTDNPRRFVVEDNTTLSATFARSFYVVTVTSASDSMGYVSGGGTYTHGTNVSVVARAHNGYRFVRWSDGEAQSARTITVVSDSTLVAYFDGGTYLIEARSNDTLMGVVSGGGYYSPNSQATLTATANAGYHFTYWNDGETSPTRTVTVTGNAVYMALFEADLYRVNASTNDPALGVVSGGGYYTYGYVVELNAQPMSHCQFLHWSDGNTENPRHIMVTSDTVIDALFAAATFNITADVADATQGFVTGVGAYNYGDTIYITAVGHTGFTFLRWEDGSVENPRRIIVTSDEHHTATMVASHYTVEAAPNDETMGFVTGAGTYAYNYYVTLTATPYNGYKFVRWSDGVTERGRSFVVTQNVSLQAIFSPLNSIVAPNGEYRVYASGGEIVVKGDVDGDVIVYDAVGRCIMIDRERGNAVRKYRMPSAGVYLVKVADNIPQRVVIVK